MTEATTPDVLPATSPAQKASVGRIVHLYGYFSDPNTPPRV
jgi:hypothetical protein